MERRRFGNTDLTVSTIGLGCYGMSGAYAPADDAESIATIRCALVNEGKTRFISLSECSAGSLRRGNAVHPLGSLQMEYSLFSRDAEEQGQINACKELAMAMM